ncbi:DUF1150 family protein [Octadecabacter sp. 1_MG-2023]|uniref:DUF1150 family protein n=1 Tax=unclassified Octadecabacter TaxID=196158 RepID=UPI001C085113|nr:MULTISPECIES: DUF1150 family protein [unclassified Octadecabacter]MBU2991942.1 DUF1150 domain-containing protein [Octadecabacter sp. B2R22]MDO6735916.1 DUF1150 family protein [Octadecabacter sp. 1_MG-2023]
MDTKFNFADMGDRVVYVKSVNVAELPEEVREAAGDREELFAVHDSEGQQLALVADRQMAFVLARQNDMQPVTVH